MSRHLSSPRGLCLTPMAAALAAVLASPLFIGHSAHAADATPPVKTLNDVVITATVMDDPLTVTTDPRQPRQPLPAHDGADYLKTIPGFSVIRKGGSDGDPVLRGMAGSRLSILLDGEMLLGGCGGRMDPPTAYIFPEAYDKITVIKGPQSVQYGPGNSAGMVMFERRFAPLVGTRLEGSLMGATAGRNDQMIDASLGNETHYLRMTGTRSAMDDYKDGAGRQVHSNYERWSGNATLGWMPDAQTKFELTGAVSDGEAAYADRMMDGAMFKRSNVGLKFEKRQISALVRRVDANVYYNYIDHVMDNYSMRKVMPGSMKMVSNPDRETMGLRVAADLQAGQQTLLTLGIDHQQNQHTLRSTGNQDRVAFESLARSKDGYFNDIGLFGEATHALNEQSRLVGGLRVDFWEAKDQRSGYVSSGQTRKDTLESGFIRHEHDLSANTTVLAGIGHNQRFPDYWELFSQGKQSVTSNSAFNVRPEKRSQLDLGLRQRLSPTAQLVVSAYYGKSDDYLLIDNSRTLKPALLTRNIDATTWGLESSLSYAINDTWKTDTTLAYVRGTNDTDGTALAQLPPLELRSGLTYDTGRLSIGALWRLVAAQNRYDKNRGNIVGQDIGSSAGFGVFSVNGSYRVNKSWKLSAGVDNLFDKNYAEHLAKGGSMISGFVQTARIYEPGRTLWLKANFALD